MRIPLPFRWGGPLVAAVMGLGSLHALHAAPGDLDLSFNGTGIVELPGYEPRADIVHDMVTVADGKLVLAGSGAGNASMIRLHADGTLDTTFGEHGKVFPSLDATTSEVIAVRALADGRLVLACAYTKAVEGGATTRGTLLARQQADGAREAVLADIPGLVVTQMRLQTDGRIVLTGTAAEGGALRLARFLPDGTTDASFEQAGPVSPALTRFVSPADLVLQPDGKLLVAGKSLASGDSQMAVCRFLADGALDTSFGGSGVVELPVNDSQATALAIQPRVATQITSVNKIVVAGYVSTPAGGSWFTARLLLDGTLDPAFSGDGVAVEPFTNSDVRVSSLVVQTSLAVGGPNHIMVGGHSADNGRRQLTVLKYRLNGELETAFDGDGKVTTDVPGGDRSECRALALQGGKLIAGGIAGHVFDWNQNFAAVRYHVADGTLDTTFEGDGVKTQNVGTAPHANSTVTGLATLPDGKILVAKMREVTRLLANGAPDAGFGPRGSTQPNLAAQYSILDVATLPDGGCVAVGEVHLGEPQFLVARFRPDGTPDPAFADKGWIAIDMGDGSFATRVAVQADGKILAAGRAVADGGNLLSLAVLRCHPDGRLDTTFDGDGKLLTTIWTSEDHLSDLLLQPDGRILLAGGHPYYSGNERPLLLMRLLPSGAEDQGFGILGRVATPVGGVTYPTDLHLQADGRILLTGALKLPNPSGYDIMLARYWPNGTLDTTFGGDGLVTTKMGASWDAGLKASVAEDGKILTGASFFSFFGAEAKAGFVKWQPDGSLDSGYGIGGKAPSPFTLSFSFDGIYTAERSHFLLEPPGHTGRALVGDGIRVTRLLTDGSTPASGLAITSVTRSGNGHLRLQGTGLPNTAHTLHASPSLQSGSFIPLGPVMPNASGYWLYNDTAAPDFTRRFYRLSQP